jgi:serine/threonine-protein kinase RsbW
VEVEYDIDPRRAIITVTDQGEGFNPAVVPDPTIDENLEKPSGRGIMLMRAYMDEVCFNNRGNQVRLVKQNH